MASVFFCLFVLMMIFLAFFFFSWIYLLLFDLTFRLYQCCSLTGTTLFSPSCLIPWSIISWIFPHFLFCWSNQATIFLSHPWDMFLSSFSLTKPYQALALGKSIVPQLCVTRRPGHFPHRDSSVQSTMALIFPSLHWKHLAWRLHPRAAFAFIGVYHISATDFAIRQQILFLWPWPECTVPHF